MNFQREESIPIFVSITYEIVFSGGGEEAFAGRELKTSQAELNEKSRRKNRTGEMEGIIFFPCVFFSFAKNLFFFLTGFWRAFQKIYFLNFPKRKNKPLENCRFCTRNGKAKWRSFFWIKKKKPIKISSISHTSPFDHLHSIEQTNFFFCFQRPVATPQRAPSPLCWNLKKSKRQ